MDTMEEFEMKPLTKGLGFHRKKVSLQDGLERSKLLVDDILATPPMAPPDELLEKTVEESEATLEDLLNSLKMPKSESLVSSPLPRRSTKVEAMDVEISRPTAPVITPAYDSDYISPKREERSSTTPTSLSFNEEGVRRSGHGEPAKKSLVKTPVSFAAAFVDAFVVLAVSLVFLMSLLMVTKIELAVVLRGAVMDLQTQIALGFLFVSVILMYVVISRIFFGGTLGEWTFDLQMGDDKDFGRFSFLFKNIWRGLLTISTGLILLPVLSFILRRDVASYFTGLQLYRKQLVV